MKLRGNGNVTLAEGSNLKFEGVQLTELKATELTKTDKKCAQCMQFFEEGDNILFIGKSVYHFDEQMIDIDCEGDFVHVTGPDNKMSCLEEYISRLITSYMPAPIVELPTESAEETKGNIADADPESGLG
jgi:hypothetical protein